MQECGRSLSSAVLNVIAEATGKPSKDLPTPLADVIDPDALDTLFLK